MLPDTTRVIHDTIYIRSADAMDILQKTHEFYDDAWSMLVYWVAGIVGVGAFAIPYVLSLIQKRKIKVENEKVLEETKREIRGLEQLIDNKVKGYAQIMNAVIAVGNQDYIPAFIQSMQSVQYFLLCNEFLNADTSLDFAINLIPKIKKSEVEKEISNISQGTTGFNGYLGIIQSFDKEKRLLIKFSVFRKRFNDLQD